jgi:murein DD-endopeptidase MepM/ murein hydrolase activator NlpD
MDVHKKGTRSEFVSRELPDRMENMKMPQSADAAGLGRHRHDSACAGFPYGTVRMREAPDFTRPRSTPRKASNRGALFVKIGICACIALFSLLLRILPFEWVAQTRTALHSLFTYDVEFDEMLGRLKFVQAIFPGVTSVFGTSDPLAYPVSGTLISQYGANGQNHIVFGCEKGAKVIACADGVVTKRGVHAVYGNYLMIEHADKNMVSIYYGLGDSALEKGEKIKIGAGIGTLGDKGELIFELRVAGRPQNPLRYFSAQ